MSENVWERVKFFFNNNFNQNVKRKELMEYVSHYNNSSVDTYRNYLYKAGYLQKVRRGIYKLIKEIPQDLTTEQIVYEAYEKKSIIVNNYFIPWKKYYETKFENISFTSSNCASAASYTIMDSTYGYNKPTTFIEDFIKEEDFKI